LYVGGELVPPQSWLGYNSIDVVAKAGKMSEEAMIVAIIAKDIILLFLT